MSDEVTNKTLPELYTECAALRAEFAQFPEDVRTQEDNSRLESMFDKVKRLDAQITLAEMEERGIRGTGPAAATRGGGVRSLHSGLEIRTPGELFVTEEMLKWARREGFSGEGPIAEFSERGSLHDMLSVRAVNEWSSTGPSSTFGAPGTAHFAGTGASNLLPVGQPIAPVPRHARLFLRDLLPKMTTTLAAIPYVRELNPTTYESASAVAEGGTKPNATLSFTGAKADPTVIAATLVISKQLFEDAAAVVQYINTRLPYIVSFKEDNEFLKGNGTWPNIEGIVNTTGVQTQTTTNTTDAQTLGNAFAKVELHDGTPTAVVLNPQNAWNMFTKRAAGGSGTFDAGVPFSALPLTVWGVPTYRTRAMTTNKALVGDFQLGGMIADREQVNVQTYRERYAELNQVLLVCEERVGLMVFRPDLFVSATLV